jgi:hypothetical protein
MIHAMQRSSDTLRMILRCFRSKERSVVVTVNNNKFGLNAAML